MQQRSYIKCLNCGKMNFDVDYCNGCGSIINIVLKRKIEREKKMHDIIMETQSRKQDALGRILASAKGHPNELVRFWASILQGIWTFAAVAVGALIAFVVAVAAG